MLQKFLKLCKNFYWKKKHYNNRSMIKINFLNKKGQYVKIIAKEGSNLLKIAKKNNINLEGSCNGEMLCSTCHVHILSNHLSKISKPSTEEKEILSLAENLKINSRLACQIKITQRLNGLIFCIA